LFLQTPLKFGPNRKSRQNQQMV